jgi:hypothetical protein
MISGGGCGNRIPIPGVPVGELTYPVVDLLHLAGSRGVVCYGPDQENGPTFVRADAWISDWQDVPVVEAEGRLLRSYLHSFGPATPEDFSVWTGMSLTGAREVWNRELFQMVSVHVEGRKAFILAQDLEDLLRTNPDEHTIRLLPHFDTFLLGHRERDHLIDEKLRSRVYRPQGWIAPAVLVDGQILALWGCHWRQKQLNVKVDPLKPLNAGILEQISNEAQKLGKFLAAENTHLIIER